MGCGFIKKANFTNTKINMSYSQNGEDLKIKSYFNGYIGHLLSIGENDGSTFSNARLLIESGWSAELVEPSPIAFDLLKNRYENVNRVRLFNIAITEKNGDFVLMESGAHVPNGNDVALVSSIHKEDYNKWHKKGVQFEPKEVKGKTFASFSSIYQKYDFITIDAEGCDWDILKQIDLTAVGCKCLCIEWNGRRDLERLFTQHCATHNMTEIHRNRENIIFAV